MTEIGEVKKSLKNKFSPFFQVNAKYSEALAQECLEWIKMITSENIDVSGDMDNFFETLKDGTLLCRYRKNFRIHVWMVKM